MWQGQGGGGVLPLLRASLVNWLLHFTPTPLCKPIAPIKISPQGSDLPHPLSAVTWQRGSVPNDLS